MSTIAHLANFYGPRSGGLRTTVNSLAREYEHFGHQTHIIVPADRKWFTRAVIADVLVKTLKSLHFTYPKMGKTQMEALGEAKKTLEAE